ncbi:hypothetical protein [Pseudodesulfovibrio sp. zrk46]|uniref:hypothetical protein n=1 Tax=Pseudodesulfovibrio sp. zrk46 TaxID=2725288 RepID=UPI001449F327|nr:hypothetical protein [Pseudodesulfovibrio sp. zrk46]QJB54970.1 hypothetical protein HFN16_00490 [Pseudodesulfovibrio sp. zrk46]
MGRRLPLLFLIFAIAGCHFVGGTIGVGNRSGVGVAFSAYGDFLYSGNGEAYSNNKKGLNQFLTRDFPAARKTFEATLAKYPTNPDATYYLGLTLIQLEERDAGYDMLQRYSDPFNAPTVQNVKWWASYCKKKPDLTPDKIHKVMNKARSEGFQRNLEYEWDRRRW